MASEQIRAIALEVAGIGMLGDRDTAAFTKDKLADFATSFLAAITEKAEPVARLHIRLEDDGLEAHVEVLNGERLQVSDSPVNVFLHPAINPAPDWLLKTAQNLALHMAKEFFPDVPQFEVMDNLSGVISQIDNMVCGLPREPIEPAVGAAPLPDEVAQRIAELEAENTNLKFRLGVMIETAKQGSDHRAELQQQRDELLFALRDWDGLIEYNYSGSREAMSAMQQCAFDTKAILDKVKS